MQELLERLHVVNMIRAEFSSPGERAELTGLARNRLVEHRLARRANALVLLDRGMSCAEVSIFLDNARYHHANLVRAWLAQPGRRIKLHFVPAYCPHLNPIER